MIDLQAMHKVVVLTLIRIGIKCDQEGFDHLIHAVEMCIKEPDYLQNFRRLLVEVAKETNAKSVGQVEASINNSINHAFATKKLDFINVLYGVQVLDLDEKPSAGQVIRLVAQYYITGVYKHRCRKTFVATRIGKKRMKKIS